MHASFPIHLQSHLSPLQSTYIAFENTSRLLARHPPPNTHPPFAPLIYPATELHVIELNATPPACRAPSCRASSSQATRGRPAGPTRRPGATAEGRTCWRRWDGSRSPVKEERDHHFVIAIHGPINREHRTLPPKRPNGRIGCIEKPIKRQLLDIEALVGYRGTCWRCNLP